MEKTSKSYQVKIYLSGDINVIKQACRKYCLEFGLCVTINKTLFIYTGGEEFGVEIGLLNYPRFETTPESLDITALELATECRNAAMQHSYLVITPTETIWNTTSEQT